MQQSNDSCQKLQAMNENHICNFSNKLKTMNQDIVQKISHKHKCNEIFQIHTENVNLASPQRLLQYINY